MLKNDIAEFDALMKHQPNIVNSLRDTRGRTLLMDGAINGHTQLVSLLSKRNHDLSVGDDHGWNAFHWIVWKDDDVSFELLNSLDATQISDVINREDKYSQTALHIAACWNKRKSIIWLIEHGADPSVKNNRGELPDETDHCDDETRRFIQSLRK